MEIKNVLIVRFRQLGDAVLTTVLCNTIRKNFPDAHIDYVVNDGMASLFEGHPSIDRVIPFTKDEREHFWTYIRKVWHIMRSTRYDVIIDKRSTFNTTPFALFSLRTPIRAALKKPYTLGLYNHRVGKVGNTPMIDHILQHLQPLERLQPIDYVRTMSLCVTDSESTAFQAAMEQQGIRPNRPLMLVGVTAKLAEKAWPEEQMTEVLRRFIDSFPQVQIIFNYAPGQEEVNARRIYQALGCPDAVFIDVQARNSRQLAVMASLVDLYFGNEGGARHIVHALQKPSLVVCSPQANPSVWIPRDATPAVAIASADATTDHVWDELQRFTRNIISP